MSCFLVVTPDISKKAHMDYVQLQSPIDACTTRKHK